jgi:hypothetical protein
VVASACLSALASDDGRAFVVTVMGVDPAKPHDAGKLGQEFAALVRGGFALARNS